MSGDCTAGAIMARAAGSLEIAVRGPPEAVLTALG